MLTKYVCVCIQTNIGSILAAVNPYKQIPGLYDGEAVQLYSKHQLGELPPHIYALANECYCCLWKRADSQCVLIRYFTLHPTGSPYTIQQGCLISSTKGWGRRDKPDSTYLIS